jgi:AraC-like DNA-binding protein
MSHIALVERPMAGNQRIRRWRNGTRPYAGAPAAHDGIEVTWMHRSFARYTIGKRTYEVPAGSMMVIPAHVEHGTYVGRNGRATALLIDVKVFDRIAGSRRPGVRAPRLEPHVVAPRPEVTAIGAALLKEAFRRDGGSEDTLRELLEALVAALVGAEVVEKGGPFVGDPRIRRALDCLHERYAETLGIDSLSRAAAMSRFHFSRVFRREVGMSPYRYLRATRVKKAASLLRSGQSTVTEAARDVGFPDLGRFIRAFRAEFGVSPGEFAKRAA